MQSHLVLRHASAEHAQALVHALLVHTLLVRHHRALPVESQHVLQVQSERAAALQRPRGDIALLVSLDKLLRLLEPADKRVAALARQLRPLHDHQLELVAQQDEQRGHRQANHLRPGRLLPPLQLAHLVPQRLHGQGDQVVDGFFSQRFIIIIITITKDKCASVYPELLKHGHHYSGGSNISSSSRWWWWPCDQLEQLPGNDRVLQAQGRSQLHISQVGDSALDRLQLHSVHNHVLLQLDDHLRHQVRAKAALLLQAVGQEEDAHVAHARHCHVLVHDTHAAQCHCAHLFSRVSQQQAIQAARQPHRQQPAAHQPRHRLLLVRVHGAQLPRRVV